MTTRVYENGVFHTLDEARPTAAAIAVRGERIIGVGTIDDCREIAGAGAQRIDLCGAVVVPGLTDSHIHTAQFARSRESVDLRTATSLSEALDRVRRHAASLPAGAWVLGGRWDRHRWAVPVQPNRRDLDTVAPDRPVALSTIDGHTSWVNSAALAILGIDRGTPDPVGGQIIRDSDGEPTGILRETATPHSLPDAATGDLPAVLRRGLTELLSNGITSIHDIDDAEALTAFENLRAADDLPIRVHKMITRADLADTIDSGRATGDGDSWIRTGPVKLFTDGALGSHSCLMSQPYAGEPENYGIAVTPYPDLVELIRTASRAGIAVAAHAIGDQANHHLLRAFAEADDPGAPGRLRHRVEHTQFLQPADVAVLAGLGVIASMQPTHCTSDIPLTDTMLADRNLACYAWASLLAAGATVTFGSDAPVEDPNPWLGLHAAVTRQREDGTPAGGWQPAERLTLAQALRCYTVAPAFASYEEHLKGRLRVGMLADFIVLESDPFAASALPVKPLSQTSVTTTVVGGEIRWSR